MTPSYAETLRPTTSDSTAPTPAMQAPLGITRAPALNGNPVVGQRVELARYQLMDSTERVLYGQRINGVVRLTDVPLAPGGRAHLVERGLQEEGANISAALQALIRGLPAAGVRSR